VSLSRGIDDSEPVRPQPIESVTGFHEERRTLRRRLLATGTLACPSCDAPVLPTRASMAPQDSLSCPVCLHDGAVREFLAVGEPTRPTKVEIFVSERPGRARARARRAV
jgi:hypothetical protein